MRLTARRRAVIAVLVSWPVAYFLVGWIAHLAFNLALDARGATLVCGTGALDLPQRFAGCGPGSYQPVLSGLILVVLAAVAVVIAYALARWVSWPIRAMADTVQQLGPTSLGLRLRASGPRDESRYLADTIDAMLDRVAEGYEAQRRFAANASHELRTPLATQRALIEVSLGSALTHEQLELVSRQLLATNERNESLVEGLLVLAETERGLMASAPVRLDDLAATVVEMMRKTAADRGLRLEVELAPVTVVGEQPLLERLLVNLVQNAVKYNADGGRVCVRTFSGGALRVTNTGPYVAPEQVAGLFEPFRRARGDRLDHGGGVGLGLTIARSVVAAHGGTITATSNPDGGLTVDVVLPTA